MPLRRHKKNTGIDGGRSHSQEKWEAKTKEARKIYTSKPWREARKVFLAANPICCAPGCTTAARIVDHRVPHRGDMHLFWDQSNWQPMCDHHHQVKRGKERHEP